MWLNAQELSALCTSMCDDALGAEAMPSGGVRAVCPKLLALKSEGKLDSREASPSSSASAYPAWWVDCFPEPRAILHRESATYHTLYAEDKDAAKAAIDAVDFSQPVVLAALPLPFLIPLRLRARVKAKLRFDMYVHVAGNQAVCEKEAEEGICVDVLQLEDAELVTAHWEHSDEVAYVEERIVSGPSACIRSADGTAVSWALTHAEGAVGAVYTMESERRKGHSARVVAALTERMRSRGLQPYCFIGASNDASAALFTKLGYAAQGGSFFWAMCDGAIPPDSDSDSDE